MSQLEKLLKQFMNSPHPKWDEVVAILSKLGYTKIEAEGSRVRFINKENDSIIRLHKLHPEKTIKTYVKQLIIKELTTKGLLK